MEKLEQKLSQYMGIIALGILSSLLLSVLVVYNSMIGVVAPIVLIFGVAIGVLVTLSLQGAIKLITGTRNQSVKATKRKKTKAKSPIKSKKQRYEDDEDEYEYEYEYEIDEYVEESDENYDDETDFNFDDDEDEPAPRQKKSTKTNKR